MPGRRYKNCIDAQLTQKFGRRADNFRSRIGQNGQNGGNIRKTASSGSVPGAARTCRRAAPPPGSGRRRGPGCSSAPRPAASRRQELSPAGSRPAGGAGTRGHPSHSIRPAPSRSRRVASMNSRAIPSLPPSVTSTSSSLFGTFFLTASSVVAISSQSLLLPLTKSRNSPLLNSRGSSARASRYRPGSSSSS